MTLKNFLEFIKFFLGIHFAKIGSQAELIRKEIFLFSPFMFLCYRFINHIGRKNETGIQQFPKFGHQQQQQEFITPKKTELLLNFFGSKTLFFSFLFSLTLCYLTGFFKVHLFYMMRLRIPKNKTASQSPSNKVIWSNSVSEW